ncbi:MAG TPA: metal-dependent hydrolase [Gaiellaceae bacterium]|nr:metal-dependent hydrolase [Gaiellaceae bacterium]
MADTTLTWLGHASFRIDTADGKRIYIDPFLNGNPKCPDDEKNPEKADIIALTHAHGDHFGDTVDIAKRTGAAVVATVEFADWLQIKHELKNVYDPNKGGTVDVDGVTFTLTDARHSSSNDRLEYMGEPVGLIVGVDGKKVYFAGDTCVFGDMELIARIYEPEVAVLPIGDHYTMGPREAAVALELLNVKRCVPCHYGTFPALTGTPDALRKLAPAGIDIDEMEPGGSIVL